MQRAGRGSTVDRYNSTYIFRTHSKHSKMALSALGVTGRLGHNRLGGKSRGARNKNQLAGDRQLCLFDRVRIGGLTMSTDTKTRDNRQLLSCLAATSHRGMH